MLHTSDVHLGAYDSGSGELREELHDTFRRVIDVGRRERVDFMLVAGDFFDNARVREETLRFAGEQMARLERPVVIAPGNHDHVGPGSVYDRMDLTTLAPGLQIIREPEGETVSVDGLPVQVWGRAHTEQDPRFTPFEQVPERGDAPWQIGAGHGHFIHPKALMHHSFHIRREHLAASDRDYVALGHWEQLTRVDAGERTVAAYSGAPEALGHTRAIGGRVLIVDFYEDGTVRLTAHSVEEADAIDHDDLPFLEGLPPEA
jgi:DNA repair exonuclease SbcCD nuclease subunit